VKKSLMLVLSMSVGLLSSATVAYAASKDTSPRTLFASNAIHGVGSIYRVVDGDTLMMNVSQSDYNKFKTVSNSTYKEGNLTDKYKTVKMRIASINTEESAHRDTSRNTAKGKASSNYLKSWASKETGEFRCYDHGDYGRPICTVSVNGRDIGYDMIKNGHSDYVTFFGKNPYYDKKYSLAE